MQGISPLLILGQGTFTSLYTQIQDQKLYLFALMENSNGKELVMELPMPLVFSYLQCLNFFDYLDDFMIFYVDDVIVYSKTKQDHLIHVWKIFEKFCHARLKLKPSKCDFFKLHIEYLGVWYEAQESNPWNKKSKQSST